jgi:acetate kinase
MSAALGGLDKLVFAGGIGENNAELRSEIAEELKFLGRFEEAVLPSQEDLQIAKITERFLTSSSDPT